MQRGEKMKILLTGGSGLLGQTLIPLLKNKHEVINFDKENPDQELTFYQGDLREQNLVEKACKNVEAIIHMAALHGKAWDQAGDSVGFEVNVTGTKNILEAAAKNKVNRVVVFTSSIWANGHLPEKAEYLPIDEKMKREPQEL